MDVRQMEENKKLGGSLGIMKNDKWASQDNDLVGRKGRKRKEYKRSKWKMRNNEGR